MTRPGPCTGGDRLVAAIALGSLLCTARCGHTPTAPTPPAPVAQSVQVSGTLPGVGFSAQLKAVATFSDQSTLDVTASSAWRTSDPEVVSVSNDGRVTGVAPGNADVSAAYGGVTGTLRLTVRPCSVYLLVHAVQTLYLKETASWWTEGQSSCAPPKMVPFAATWQSLDPGIATVTVAGVGPTSSVVYVTGVAPGTTTISAIAGDATVLTRVTILPMREPPPDHLRLDLLPGPITVGKDTTVTVFAEWDHPIGGAPSRKTVTGAAAWSSSHPLVATVTAGLITGISPGQANVTATYSGVSLTFGVTVIPRNTITFISAVWPLRVMIGDTILVTATAAYDLETAASGRVVLSALNDHYTAIRSTSIPVTRGMGTATVALDFRVPATTSVCPRLELYAPSEASALAWSTGPCVQVREPSLPMR